MSQIHFCDNNFFRKSEPKAESWKVFWLQSSSPGYWSLPSSHTCSVAWSSSCCWRKLRALLHPLFLKFLSPKKQQRQIHQDLIPISSHLWPSISHCWSQCPVKHLFSQGQVHGRYKAGFEVRGHTKLPHSIQTFGPGSCGRWQAQPSYIGKGIASFLGTIAGQVRMNKTPRTLELFNCGGSEPQVGAGQTRVKVSEIWYICLWNQMSSLFE